MTFLLELCGHKITRGELDQCFYYEHTSKEEREECLLEIEKRHPEFEDQKETARLKERSFQWQGHS